MKDKVVKRRDREALRVSWVMRQSRHVVYTEQLGSMTGREAEAFARALTAMAAFVRKSNAKASK